MNDGMINLGMFVADIMSTWPQTVKVFLKYRMTCVGCQLSEFDTLKDVLLNYGYSPDKILTELNAALRDNTPSSER
ncbi:MAG: DUF1858 domain-containing protein [Chloroflexi bacterium]|jgi:hybrid cluster-associated redox disulfide protein|nr:DUF1858 domain-containing protein [Chloroflexota bacterium]